MLSVGLFMLPFHALTGTLADIVHIFKTWKQYALEFEADYRRQKVPSHAMQFRQKL
jgi:hypothetical protein